MGRMKATSRCSQDGCEQVGNRQGLCQRHYQRWYRQYGHVRCEYAGCSNMLRRVGSSKTVGRRLSHGGRATAYCREHEWHHLSFTQEVYELNRSRFARTVEPAEGCWLWTGPKTSAAKPYGKFVPEGGGDKYWVAHRVAYGLLVGGHKQKQVLDHLCGKPLCVLPAHLEPVTQAENLQRRGVTTRTPLLANNTTQVLEFAEEFALPLPDHVGPLGLAA